MVRATWEVLSSFYLNLRVWLWQYCIEWGTITIVYTMERCNIVYNVERYKVDDDHSKMRMKTRGKMLSDGCIREKQLFVIG
jgi:hypothetical protein